ncbi:baseplate J/gp47 family protein [Pseudomonas syringae]|nr:baseplate J/gp47 family protein [Pseudomonas syringae]
MGANRDNARIVLAAALDPDSCRVDERDHRDRLAFAADFATLVLYYDKSNQINGEWSRFFLKDPAILMAAISKTEPSSYYAGSCTGVSGQSVEVRDVASIGAGSQLCVLTTNMFVLLDRWLQFMNQSPDSYVLRAFLDNRIEGLLARLLWDMVAWQQALSIITHGRVAAPDRQLFAGFESVWHGVRDYSAVEVSLLDPTLATVYKSLQQIYQQVFSIFTQVVGYAGHAFKKCQNLPTRHADTALLMAFSKLMEIQQREINLLGHKHLDFYYRQVLLQNPRPAQADQVHVCLSLSPRFSSFTLPAGTPFKAGTYADGSDIIFVNDQQAQLSRAAITQVRTLYYPAGEVDAVLYSATVSDPGKLVQDPVHGTRYWNAFGNDQGLAVEQGFAIASPMLLLQSGKRSITITLGLTCGDAPVTVFPDAGCRYFLSTEKAWLQVKPVNLPVTAVEAGITLHFELSHGDPAIVAFGSAMDGFSSQWPMFKVILGPAHALDKPCSLETVSISVSVEGYSRLVLANDNSVLPSTGTFQPFGPVPVVGQNFYVGSNECFAKPLSEFGLSMTWEGLPADLSNYYQAYNTYIQDARPGTDPVFGASAFKVSWRLLKNKSWPLLQVWSALPDVSQVGITQLFQQNDGTSDQAGAVTTTATPASSTFKVYPESGRAYPESDSVFPAAPELALAPLPPVRLADNGYIRIQLVDPPCAFGHSLYASVVASVSLHNAQSLIQSARTKRESLFSKLSSAFMRLMSSTAKTGQTAASGSDSPPNGPATSDTSGSLLDLPNPPYTPVLQKLVASYKASVTLDIVDTGQSVNHPLEIYHYGSFKPYLAYDAQRPDLACGFTQLTPQVAQASRLRLPLYPGVAGNGSLYLALGNLVAPCSLSLFLNILTDEHRVVSASEKAVCFYWTAKGWAPLEVLDDGTCNLSCPGIITLEIPAASAAVQTAGDSSWMASPVMPAEGFWLAIAAPSDARNIRVTYLDTQGVTLRRSSVASVPDGEIPVIGPGSIVSTLQKTVQVAGVVQPFTSSGGLPSEDRASYDQANSFYRRVSMRLNHKDRASSQNNYVEMALQACPDLYYAQVSANLTRKGAVSIGLVNSYPDATHPDAFRPLVDAAAQLAIQTYIARRTSAMVVVGVRNLNHQVVRVKAQLVLSPGASVNAVLKDLNQRLRLYLSPWIASDQPQMDIASGLSRSELASFISQHPDVLTVFSLHLLLVSVGQGADCAVCVQTDPLLANSGSVLVSAERHQLLDRSGRTGTEVRYG